MAPSSQETIYFGYGSNLWQHQMQLRCPTSTYLGVARLNGYRWIINERGYANVVEGGGDADADADDEKDDDGDADSGIDNKYASVVFGLVYALQPSDEHALDKNEGVPVAYTKESLPCDFWTGVADASTAIPSTTDEQKWIKVDTTRPPTKTARTMLVYIDRKRTALGRPREEYVVRMNQGVRDALARGVPRGYVEGVVRRFVKGGGGEGVEDLALRQAGRFEDESGVV
ncbi:hypothetical protein BDV95DRAFT_481488 [Massariosphaeria phaeospora]|uniref:gamma-glutamylcyclotransferase n=1 Tax=Massariosphaeria phaeospora TaxID=100035 RepID=A0A7C8MN22_9PLEO|nr:hypothetical protein BDV95DRAFT_481488 [Massariosphaeria phaeospora]